MTLRFLVEGEDSAGSVAMFEFDTPAGAGVPIPHSHDGYQETIYGVQGVLTWTVDGTPIDVGPGEALCIRRGAVHSFANAGEVDARALAVVTPGVLGPDYFRELAAVADAASPAAALDPARDCGGHAPPRAARPRHELRPAAQAQPVTSSVFLSTRASVRPSRRSSSTPPRTRMRTS